MYRFASSDPLDCHDAVPMPVALTDLRVVPDSAVVPDASDVTDTSEGLDTSDASRAPEPADLFGRPAPLAGSEHLEVRLAGGAADVAAALSLRHRVLAEEAGLVGVNDARRDLDIFDPYCRHLVARDRRTDRVVGTCRLLLPEPARRLGSLFSEREFDLGPLAPLRDRLVEVGRLCVAPDHRDGRVLMLLWRAICRFTRRQGHRWLIGCCSLSGDLDGAFGASVHRRLAGHHADAALQVRPRRRRSSATGVAVALDEGRQPIDTAAPEARPATGPAAGPVMSLPLPPLPALLRGYLLAGAQVLGEPFHDATHRCSDLPLLLDVRSMNTRFGRRVSG